MSSTQSIQLLVEEASMQAFLDQWLQEYLGDGVIFDIQAYEGARDLVRKLPERIRGYRNWKFGCPKLVVLIDRDSADCELRKQEIDSIFIAEGLEARGKGVDGTWQAAACIVIQELEAWYFGEWAAVRRAYPRLPPEIQNRARYRRCDDIDNPWDQFLREMQQAQGFRGGMSKVAVAENVGVHFRPDRCASPSFQHFCKIVFEAKGGLEA